MSPLVPMLVGFLVATSTTPAGVSGAFLLLPFQFSVLGYTAPGVTPTNLLYNVFSTPGGIFQYRRQADIDWALVRRIALGAVPGIVAGAWLRITIFGDPATFKIFIGFALLALGLNLILNASTKSRGGSFPARNARSLWIPCLSAIAGLIGGIYGISGGSIIAPALVGIFRVSVRRAAPAALIATFLTSSAGIASFEILELLAVREGPASGRPDWALALLFGVGGAMGGNLGARLNTRIPETALKILLGILAVLLGGSYLRTIM